MKTEAPQGHDAVQLARFINSTVFRFSDERNLQDRIEDLLNSKGVEYVREVVLSPKNRIDFMSGTIGIEVKVDSSATTVQRQLWRYAEDERIQSLILVTTLTKHRSIARELLGKPIIVVHLLASIF
jgi:hypothetical protein